MNVIINPGTGPIGGGRGSDDPALLKHAVKNIRAFIKEVSEAFSDGPRVTSLRKPSLDVEGRYGFVLARGKRKVEVDMPGRPLAEVRYVSEGQNARDFPRLYVDGSSWLWLFALGCARDTLHDHDGQQDSAGVSDGED